MTFIVSLLSYYIIPDINLKIPCTIPTILHNMHIYNIAQMAKAFSIAILTFHFMPILIYYIRSDSMKAINGGPVVVTDNRAYINGLTVEADSGKTIVEAAAELSIHIPVLCKYPKGNSLGACGVCVVENRADGSLIRSCSNPVEPGMDIRTESPAAVEERRKAITRLIESGHHNCFVLNMPISSWTDRQLQVMSLPWHDAICPAWGHCELQNLAVKYGIDELRPAWDDKVFPLDDGHPMFVRDYSRCIRCGRCIQACNDVQVNSAIPLPEGWDGETPPPDDSYPLVDYDLCVHCGECVQACPVGALFEKKAYRMNSGNDVDYIRTTCPYCGVGCQMHLHVKDDRIIKITGVEEAEPNKGRLCVKGRFGYDFIYSEERLKTPLIKKNGKFQPASWDEALDLVSRKISEAVEKHGPDSVAGVSCARSINEDSYQMQKLFRAVIKTNNIDHCART